MDQYFTYGTTSLASQCPVDTPLMGKSILAHHEDNSKDTTRFKSADTGNAETPYQQDFFFLEED